MAVFRFRVLPNGDITIRAELQIGPGLVDVTKGRAANRDELRAAVLAVKDVVDAKRNRFKMTEDSGSEPGRVD